MHRRDRRLVRICFCSAIVRTFQCTRCAPNVHQASSLQAKKKPQLIGNQSVAAIAESKKRRGRDSNSRYRCRYSGFRDRPIQPLWHLSGGQEFKGQVFVPTSHVRLKELQRREGSSELSINLDATSIRVRSRGFGPHGVILSVERQDCGFFFHDRLDVHRAAPELGQVRQRVPSVV